jgi:hypothetical protein
MIRTIPNPTRPGGLRPVEFITDRALRYRANRNPPPEPRICHYCGSGRNVDLEHIDGREENTNPENLLWACRSCNTKKGRFFALQGVGRKTRQYNPSGARGARTLREWLTASTSVLGPGPLSPGQAIARLQKTAPAKRAEYARALRNPEMGPHGPILREFHHDAPGAIARLKQLETGEAVGALYHPEVGDIDLIWGKAGTPAKDFRDGYGLAHILARPDRRPIVSHLQELLLGMKPQKSHSVDEIRLSDGGHHIAIVSLVWQPKGQKQRTDKTWLLTAFYDERKGNGKKPSAGSFLTFPALARPERLFQPGGPSTSIGRKRPQGNPTAPTYEQYLWAVKNHLPGARDEAGKIIHATPSALRSEYAKKIAQVKARRGTNRRRREEVPF